MFTALDASGTSRHSFVWGQNAWLGSKIECDYLNTPPIFSITTGLYKAMDPKLISAVAPMPVEFKMLFVNFSTPYKIDTIIHVNVSTKRIPLNIFIFFKCFFFKYCRHCIALDSAYRNRVVTTKL